MGTEEKEKPITLTLKVIIPTRESLVTAIKQLFPLLEVTVEEKKKPEEAPPVKPEG